jgi:hypothetical protein
MYADIVLSSTPARRRIMRQVIIRIVRSASQILTLGLLQMAVPILDWINQIGVPVDQAEFLVAVETVLFAGTVAGLTWLEGRFPVVSRILSFNLADNSGIAGYQPRHLST